MQTLQLNPSAHLLLSHLTAELLCNNQLGSTHGSIMPRGNLTFRRSQREIDGVIYKQDKTHGLILQSTQDIMKISQLECQHNLER